jgi:HAD superfamily hydrolase (TIGR01509 family)
MTPARRPLQAVVFDLDGLAVDSEPLHVEAWGRAVRAGGRDFDPAWIEPYFGSPVRTTAEGLSGQLGLDAEELLERRNTEFERLMTEGLPSRPGLAEAVERLRAAGLRMAIVTSGQRGYADVALEGLRRHDGISFELAVTRDDVERPKPDPEPYRTAAERLGLDPSECAALEDAPTGVRSAKRAGMLAIAVPNEHTERLDFREADTVQPDLATAVEWLLGIQVQ